jgi:hypothetical protein
MRRLALIAAAFALIVPATASASARHGCPTFQPRFIKSIRASTNVSCQMALHVVRVAGGQEFGPYHVDGFSWHDQRRYFKGRNREWTRYYTVGGRNVYLMSLPYG